MRTSRMPATSCHGISAACLGRRRDPLGRLTDDLEVADHRILQQRRGEEGLLALMGVAAIPVNRVANMQQVGTVVRHSCCYAPTGRASATIVSRSEGDSPSSVTPATGIAT